MPEGYMFLSPVVVPTEHSVDRPAPVAGCLKRHPFTRGALKCSAGRRDNGLPEKRCIYAVHMHDLEDWEPYGPNHNIRHHDTGLRWTTSEVEDKYQDVVHELDIRYWSGEGTTPAEAHAKAKRLEKEVTTAVARTACVADAAMEALLDSGATDNTVGRKALTKEQ